MLLGAVVEIGAHCGECPGHCFGDEVICSWAATMSEIPCRQLRQERFEHTAASSSGTGIRAMGSPRRRSERHPNSSSSQVAQLRLYAGTDFVAIAHPDAVKR
jgi:hypothetical protein